MTMCSCIECVSDMPPEPEEALMTTKHGELIRQLREDTDRDVFSLMEEAADTIEELLAQNRRLRFHVERLIHLHGCTETDSVYKEEVVNSASQDLSRALEPKP